MNTILISKDFGTDISSRSIAANLRRETERLISLDLHVNLDFEGVRTISESFADELFGILVESRGEEWFKTNVKVSNLSPIARLTVLEAIAARLHEAA